MGELGQETGGSNGSGSSGLGVAGLANKEHQGDKARIIPLGNGLVALPKKLVESIIAYGYIDFNKTLGRAQDPRANGAWLSKRTE